MKIGMVIIPVCIIIQMVTIAGEVIALPVKWSMLTKWQTVQHLAGATLLKQQTLTQTAILVFMQASTIMALHGDNVLQMWHQANQPIIFKQAFMKNGMAVKR